MALVVLPWLEVVAGPQVAEARVFGRLGLVDELGSSELFVGQHETDTRPRRRRRSGWRVSRLLGAAPGRQSGGAQHACARRELAEGAP